MTIKLERILTIRPFKRALVEFELRELKLYLKNLLFIDKGPGLGQIPGLLGHGSQIPDRTIETNTPTDLCSKFQLSRCYTG